MLQRLIIGRGQVKNTQETHGGTMVDMTPDEEH